MRIGSLPARLRTGIGEARDETQAPGSFTLGKAFPGQYVSQGWHFENCALDKHYFLELSGGQYVLTPVLF